MNNVKITEYDTNTIRNNSEKPFLRNLQFTRIEEDFQEPHSTQNPMRKEGGSISFKRQVLYPNQDSTNRILTPPQLYSTFNEPTQVFRLPARDLYQIILW